MHRRLMSRERRVVGQEQVELVVAMAKLPGLKPSRVQVGRTRGGHACAQCCCWQWLLRCCRDALPTAPAPAARALHAACLPSSTHPLHAHLPQMLALAASLSGPDSQAVLQAAGGASSLLRLVVALSQVRRGATIAPILTTPRWSGAAAPLRGQSRSLTPMRNITIIVTTTITAHAARQAGPRAAAAAARVAQRQPRARATAVHCRPGHCGRLGDRARAGHAARSSARRQAPRTSAGQPGGVPARVLPVWRSGGCDRPAGPSAAALGLSAPPPSSTLT